MKRSILTAVIAVLTITYLATPVQAGFIGHEVTAEWLYPTMNNVLEIHDVVVSTAMELPVSAILNDFKYSIDIGDDYILFLFHSNGTWQDVAANGWQFSDKSGTIKEIVGLTIGMATSSITGLDPEDLTFTSDSICVNFGDSGPTGTNVSYTMGSTIRLNVEFIPEPATLFLLSLGGLLLRRRK